MRIYVTSVLVDDQDKALRFYTEILGFVKKTDIPVGEFKWLTLVSPEGPAEVELLLEPNNNPASLAFQSSIHQQGIPITSFAVDDILLEHERLVRAGVTFTMPPTQMGPVWVAVFDDTCGNLIQIAQLT